MSIDFGGCPGTQTITGPDSDLSQDVKGRLEFVDSVIGVSVGSLQILKGLEAKIEPIQKALDDLWEISSVVESPLLCAMHLCDPAVYPLSFEATAKVLPVELTPGAPEKERKKAAAQTYSSLFNFYHYKLQNQCHCNISTTTFFSLLEEAAFTTVRIALAIRP